MVTSTNQLKYVNKPINRCHKSMPQKHLQCREKGGEEEGERQGGEKGGEEEGGRQGGEKGGEEEGGR